MTVHRLCVVVPCEQDLEPREVSLSAESNSNDDLWRLLGLESSDDVVRTLLLRPFTEQPGLYACHGHSDSSSLRPSPLRPNVRATRLCMACGLFSRRLYGDVVLMRDPIADLSLSSVHAILSITPDMRDNIAQSVVFNDNQPSAMVQSIPKWIADAAMRNYHDAKVLAQLAAAMTERPHSGSDSDEYYTDNEDGENENGAAATTRVNVLSLGMNMCESQALSKREIVTRVPLCLHCRRPSNSLCQGCQGAYFCDEPRSCRQDGYVPV
jgi:hypothetical protein